ncbi:glycoside hydrolase family 105 protein [Paenibacillus sp. PDC88]|uniref:glycoside hydrolase family 88/105 protein n=1 Tax=Paenibacillus sp. PDC88 TaxID=1884375 RepID=UPI00089C58D8|nr:glycoside hydrolase family 88 protein [Paenibacillus sp. PDC88]SDX51990.1 Rhamnogalacturonyl hydrolase YesR [Paenibacillus sp. PDC88]
MRYFHENESIASRTHDAIEDVLSTIAQRYIGDNPKQSFLFRAYNEAGFNRLPDYRYEMNLNDRLPDAPSGSYAFIWGKLWSQNPNETKLNMSLSCYSPVTIYVNGELFFKSDLHQELFPDRRWPLAVPVQYGWNDIVLQFVKTDVGFGGVFGTGSFKNFPLHFINPSADRNDQEGWMYSEFFTNPEQELPRLGMKEKDTDLIWYPRQSWTKEELDQGVFGRMYGLEAAQTAYAWSTFHVKQPEGKPVRIKGRHDGALSLYVDGEEVYASSTSGEIDLKLPRIFGAHQLIAKGTNTEAAAARWGFELKDFGRNSGVSWNLPYRVAGSQDSWLYLGPFDPSNEPQLSTVQEVNRIHGDDTRGVYYRIDLPNTVIRPYLESTHYGKWNYPLGVTLLGLMQTGLELGEEAYVRYAVEHISLSTSFDKYGLWDRATYGAAGINNQLSAIDSLDDCGSFGATMLFAMEQASIPGGRDTADRIAKYMREDQERLPDGAFFRRRGAAEMRQETMWCDDLYMSTPFLTRYAKLAGDSTYLEDAVQQFLLFKQYLYIPERKIMSHVYDFVRGSATGIPWGRGNGWVLFSLTELLTMLPETHEKRSELLGFYRDLCEGYLALQGENGLWHQVLNRPDSYEESSCTSMFIYAYAKGVRFGWLKDAGKYVDSVLRGWEGLTRIAIDYKGNIYGVCRGSGYSFTASYYKDDLGWNLNDTHGIGIVLLAGVEALRMQVALRESADSDAFAVSGQH